jgi:hypothetical protein
MEKAAPAVLPWIKQLSLIDLHPLKLEEAFGQGATGKPFPKMSQTASKPMIFESALHSVRIDPGSMRPFFRHRAFHLLGREW